MIPRPYTCLNGRFVLHDRAAIPVADRGFRFGDGVFETIKIVNGVPYAWEFHLSRMMDGLAALHITIPMYDMPALVRAQLHKNKQMNGYLRIAISRGVGSRGYRPHPKHAIPTLVMESLNDMPAPQSPYTLWLSKYSKPSLTALPVNLKLAQGLNSTLAIMEADEHKADEALLLNGAGELCEGASSNLFWLTDDTIFTPALDTGCLRGTTRDALIRLSPLPIKTVQTGLASLEAAEAVWITNGRLGIHPVLAIEPLGYRYDMHRMTRKLQQLLHDDMQRYAVSHRKEWS
jgi:branched-subunit amino acid aminotransferase/4-amino-4-deoxychorismate lyase